MLEHSPQPQTDSQRFRLDVPLHNLLTQPPPAPPRSNRSESRSGFPIQSFPSALNSSDLSPSMHP
jgi:hypothetical protein